MTKKPVTIHWAIGSSDGPRSSAWFLSGNKRGDIYVALSIFGGTIKVSFHRDGWCQVGFAEKYKATAVRRFGIPSRHWDRWELATAQALRVLQIFVPHSELRSFVGRNPHKITWLPTPPEGSVAVISIFMTPPGIKLPPPRGAHVAFIVGTVSTSTRTAWLVYAHHPIDAACAKLIQYGRAKLDRSLKAGNSQLATCSTLWTSKEDHARHVLEALELACDRLMPSMPH